MLLELVLSLQGYLIMMLKNFAAFEVFFEENLPRLFNHFQSSNLTPDFYLIDWIFTLYSKSFGSVQRRLVRNCSSLVLGRLPHQSYGSVQSRLVRNCSSLALYFLLLLYLVC